jgi:CspA family cold shock protein
MTNEDKKEGRVKFFNNFRKFGFIKGDDNTDYFIHLEGIKGWREGKLIKEGDRVSFKVVKGDRGPKADEVEIVIKKKIEPGAPVKKVAKKPVKKVVKKKVKKATKKTKSKKK